MSETLYTAIHIEGNWVVVSDEKIKISDYVYDPSGAYVFRIIKGENKNSYNKKIIYQSSEHYPGIPVARMSWLEDVKVLALEKYPVINDDNLDTLLERSIDWNERDREAFIDGYIRRAASHPYSLEDMEETFEAAKQFERTAYHPDFTEFIHSLSQFPVVKVEDNNGVITFDRVRS